MALFDTLKNIVHDTTTAVFGESCFWVPSNGGQSHTVQVNFQEPDDSDKLGDFQNEYLAWDTRMEYRSPQFEGLKASVDQGTREIVTIKAKDYRVTKVMRQFDGATFYAKLEEVA